MACGRRRRGGRKRKANGLRSPVCGREPSPADSRRPLPQGGRGKDVLRLRAVLTSGCQPQIADYGLNNQLLVYISCIQIAFIAVPVGYASSSNIEREE